MSRLDQIKAFIDHEFGLGISLHQFDWLRPKKQ